MTKIFSCILLLAMVALLSVPVLADDQNATPVATTSTTVPVTTATTVETTIATTVPTTPVPAPVASFAGSPTSGTAPLTVQFTDTSTGSPTSWSWDFGDGGSSTEQNPLHTYTIPGTYTITLIATNNEGSNTSTEDDYITVGAAATPVPTPAFTQIPTTGVPPSVPVASFIEDPFIGSAPLTVQFTDLSEGSPTSWSWDFGDGGSSSEENPSYTYSAPGSYTVTLTVSNSAGSNTSVGTDKITVLSPGPTQSPLLPVAAVIALGIAAIASAGLGRGKRH